MDNTLIVVSGDHGPPGFPHGKCNLYDFGTSVSLAIRWGGAKGGRTVDDLVSLTDLAPTFLQLGGVAIPPAMTGRSLVNVLTSTRSGQVDPARTAVFIGRERHVDNARNDFMPYPQRAIRTPDFLYIINFKPNRWPLGEPFRLVRGPQPTADELADDTQSRSATKTPARPRPGWWASATIRAGSVCIRWPMASGRAKNSTTSSAIGIKSPTWRPNRQYAKTRRELERRLLAELSRTGDPRWWTTASISKRRRCPVRPRNRQRRSDVIVHASTARSKSGVRPNGRTHKPPETTAAGRRESSAEKRGCRG